MERIQTLRHPVQSIPERTSPKQKMIEICVKVRSSLFDFDHSPYFIGFWPFFPPRTSSIEFDRVRHSSTDFDFIGRVRLPPVREGGTRIGPAGPSPSHRDAADAPAAKTRVQKFERLRATSTFPRISLPFEQHSPGSSSLKIHQTSLEFARLHQSSPDFDYLLSTFSKLLSRCFAAAHNLIFITFTLVACQ